MKWPASRGTRLETTRCGVIGDTHSERYDDPRPLAPTRFPHARPYLATPRPRPVEDEPTLPNEPEGDIPIPKIRDPHENEKDDIPYIEPTEPGITPFEPPQKLPVR